jgi:hypothetical protein
MGRPVVSGLMKSLQAEPAGRMVAWADGPSEFCEQIDRCLTDEAQEAAPIRMEAAAPYSWDRLFASLSAVCEEALGP